MSYFGQFDTAINFLCPFSKITREKFAIIIKSCEEVMTVDATQPRRADGSLKNSTFLRIFHPLDRVVIALYTVLRGLNLILNWF